MTAYLTNAVSLEMMQRGVFGIVNLTPEQKQCALQAQAPDLSFCAAREVVGDALLHAGLPSFLLARMHFSTLYQQQKEKAKHNNVESNQADFAIQSVFDGEGRPVLQ